MENPGRYYAILGLQPGASRAQVEQSYRAAEMDLHAQRLANDPQVRGKAQARLKIINEAYLAIVTTSEEVHTLPEDRGIPSGPPPDPAHPHSNAADAAEGHDTSPPVAGPVVVRTCAAGTADAEVVSPPPHAAAPLEIRPDPRPFPRKWALFFFGMLAALLLILLVILFRPDQRHPPLLTGKQETPAGFAELSGRAGRAARPPELQSADVITIRRDAERGNVRAQTVLGYLCTRGAGVPQDYAEAARWFGSAAAQGDAEAQDWLGYLYETGQGVSQDFGEAARWYRLSAEQENADAEKNLGLMYARGSGVAASGEEAARWLKKAAAHGSREAQEALKRLQVE